MSRIHRVLPVRWLLPIAQLVLSIAILFPVRHELAQQVNDAVRFSRLVKTRAPTVDEVLAVVVPERLTPQAQAELASFEKRKWIPSVLNLPSGLIQLPYVILNPDKEEWVPVGMDLMTWRAISWPLLGILFWWSTGRGIEALLAAPRGLIQPKISLVETVIGGALFLFCAVAAICLPLFDHRRDPDFPMKLFSCGLAMWALLGGLVVAARVFQWRIRSFRVSNA